MFKTNLYMRAITRIPPIALAITPQKEKKSAPNHEATKLPAYVPRVTPIIINILGVTSESINLYYH